MSTRLESGVATCLALAVAAAVVTAACSSPASSADTPASANTPDASVQTLTLVYDAPVVGAVVTASAAGLPPGADAELQWATVSGGWVIEDYYHFRRKHWQHFEDVIPGGVGDRDDCRAPHQDSRVEAY